MFTEYSFVLYKKVCLFCLYGISYETTGPNLTIFTPIDSYIILEQHRLYNITLRPTGA